MIQKNKLTKLETKDTEDLQQVEHLLCLL